MTLVNREEEGSSEDPFILAVQASQVFYVRDPIDHRWEVVVASKKSYVNDIFDEEVSCVDDNTPLESLVEVEKLFKDDGSLKRFVARVDHEDGTWVTSTGKVSKRKRKKAQQAK
jgi:uncharacterized protein DUF4216